MLTFLSKFITPDLASRSQFWLPDMHRLWFHRKIALAQWFWLVQFIPEVSFQILILAPRYAQTLISEETWFRAMILACFSLLQSLAFRSQFWLRDMLRPWFRRKMVLAQWFWAVSVYSRAEPPNPNSDFQICSDLDFEGKWFPRNDFGPFHSTPELSFQIPVLAPRYAQTLFSKENRFCAMILDRFSLLQSVASRSEFWLSTLPRHWFSGKIVLPQWLCVVSVSSSAQTRKRNSNNHSIGLLRSAFQSLINRLFLYV